MNGLVRAPHPRGRSVGLADGSCKRRWASIDGASTPPAVVELSAPGLMSERSLHGAQFIEMHDESLTCRLSAASAKRCAVSSPSHAACSSGAQFIHTLLPKKYIRTSLSTVLARYLAYFVHLASRTLPTALRTLRLHPHAEPITTAAAITSCTAGPTWQGQAPGRGSHCHSASVPPSFVARPLAALGLLKQAQELAAQTGSYCTR